MSDGLARETPRPSESLYAVTEGQRCFDGCEGHFRKHSDGGEEYLACDVCGMYSATVASIAAAAIRDYHDRRGIEDALRVVNSFRARVKELPRRASRGY